MKNSKNIRIKRYLLDSIANGSLAVGDRAPSENELSKMFGVHHSTAEKALRELAYEGYIERRRGSGSYIANPESSKTGNIAIIVNDVNSHFFADLIHEVQKQLEKYNRRLIFFGTSEKFSLEVEYINQLIDKKQADGLLIVPALDVESSERRNFYRKLRGRNIPFVLLFPPDKQPECNTVFSDGRNGNRIATEYLINQGYRNIAFIVHQLPDNNIMEQRLAGYRDALDAAGLPFDEKLLIKIPYPSMEYGFRAAEVWLNMCPRPDSVLAVADILAVGFAMRLREHGIRIPEDIPLIGNGNIELCRPENCNISSLDDALDKVSEEAVKMLMAQLSVGKDVPSHVVIPQRLVVRPPVKRPALKPVPVSVG